MSQRLMQTTSTFRELPLTTVLTQEDKAHCLDGFS